MPQEIADSVVSMELCFSFRTDTEKVIRLSFLAYFWALQS
jgi:hypothetical protein